MTQGDKLSRLAEMEGLTLDEMLEQSVFDSIVPAICANEGCDYSEAMEPDQEAGWCPECEANSVKSCLILAGMI